MLVGFVGSPCSGKTTVAARLFAELKETGLPAEYIAEKARSYIAEKRFRLRMDGREADFCLTDEDQLKIAKKQYISELYMNEHDVVVISDSCVLNSLLYMSDEALADPRVQALARGAVAHYDILFFCYPVERPRGIDPNRVHDETASLAVHHRILPLLTPYLGDKPLIQVDGPARVRLGTVLPLTLNAFAHR